MLSNLYRNLADGKKIFEFLGHDFSEDRWKKAAARNAYQLFSQKKYMLAASFYLLGGKINEATQVAISHLKDLHLAVTICRMTEGEGSEELKKIYKEHYIDKGTLYNDPWLTMMGRWLSGQYVKALNCISEDRGQDSEAGMAGKDQLDPRYNIFYKEESAKCRNLTDEWNFENPTLSTFNASIIVLCKKLEKHYLVTTALQSSAPSQAKNAPVENSIFESFMEPAEKPKEEKAVVPTEQLSFKIESLILRGAHRYSLMKLPHLALHMVKGESVLLRDSIKLFITKHT